MDTNQLTPTKRRTYSFDPHPLKSFFRSRGITQATLKTQLKIHQSELSMWLSGVKAMPSDIEARLNKIAKKIEQEEKKRN